MLMRHAKSDWSTPGLSDHDRPLNARGCRSAPLMADFLSKQALQADVILVSSAVRAQQTLEWMREKWSSEAVVWTVASLYLASPDEIARQIHSLHDSWHRALVIGHNPGLSELASRLSGQAIELPTAAVALFSSSATNWCGALTAHRWDLQAVWKPRDLEA